MPPQKPPVFFHPPISVRARAWIKKTGQVFASVMWLPCLRFLRPCALG
jgi:hypothetical protein